MRDIPKFMTSEFFYYKGDVQALKPEAPEELKREFEECYNLEYDIEEDYPDIETPYHTWDGRIESRPEFKATRDKYNMMHAWEPI